MKISSCEIASTAKQVSAKVKSLDKITYEFLGICAFEATRVGTISARKGFRYLLS